MNRITKGPLSQNHAVFTAVVSVVILFSTMMSAQITGTNVRVSTDTFDNQDSVHRTEVEPHTFAYGSTIVSAFQVARVFAGGGADIGFATSTNGGKSWVHGYLPGLTVNYQGGTFTAASDAAVAYDAKHGVWLIISLPVLNNNPLAVAVNRSVDGINWQNPVIVDQSGSDDKTWIVCDNSPTSQYYGNCYAEWDEPGLGDLIFMSTSTDGGLTWGQKKMTADRAAGLGGQPLVQPNGTVVVPIDGFSGMIAFSSTNGGASWNSSVLIARQNFRGQDGNLRSPGLPSADIDKNGKIYVVWPDCSFRSGCSTDDLVFSTSTDGTTWTAPKRIPLTALDNPRDHFIPGIGVDHNTGGTSAHISILFYYYPNASCRNSCQLYLGTTSSRDGGQTWTLGRQIEGQMSLSWLAPSQNGLMAADYQSVAYSNGNAFGVFVTASAPANGLLNEAMYTTMSPIGMMPLGTMEKETYVAVGDEKPIPGVQGRYVWKYYDDEGNYPIPPSKQVPPPDHY
ncbi:MAG TPA: sialidase family protein [Terriglobales bacterium]|nr:sialidase family protein [Terriglobales bacterium]